MGLPNLAPPNITPDPKTGIRAWTDSEKIRAIREGVDKDGRAPFPMMPYENFRHMSDDVSEPGGVPRHVHRNRLAAPDRRDTLKYGEVSIGARRVGGEC
jgi:hypothetical protein